MQLIMLINGALIIMQTYKHINVNMRMHLKYLLIVFTSSSTEVSSITGLKGEPPPLLTPSTISATKTKHIVSKFTGQCKRISN